MAFLVRDVFVLDPGVSSAGFVDVATEGVAGDFDVVDGLDSV